MTQVSMIATRARLAAKKVEAHSHNGQVRSYLQLHAAQLRSHLIVSHAIQLWLYMCTAKRKEVLYFDCTKGCCALISFAWM